MNDNHTTNNIFNSILNCNEETKIVKNSEIASSALAIFKTTIKKAEKDAEGYPRGSFKYATLDSIVSAINEAINDLPEQIKVSYSIKLNNSSNLRASATLAVTCSVFSGNVMHHYLEEYESRIDCEDGTSMGKSINPIQVAGSIITYLSRYMLRAFFLGTMDSSDDMDSLGIVNAPNTNLNKTNHTKPIIKPESVQKGTESLKKQYVVNSSSQSTDAIAELKKKSEKNIRREALKKRFTNTYNITLKELDNYLKYGDIDKTIPSLAKGIKQAYKLTFDLRSIAYNKDGSLSEFCSTWSKFDPENKIGQPHIANEISKQLKEIKELGVI